MIVAATPRVLTMTSSTDTLDLMDQQLAACERGELPIGQLARLWRTPGSSLPLPPRYAQVLGDLLDRIEAGALFSEESCSFSQKDLLGSLQQWSSKARLQLAAA